MSVNENSCEVECHLSRELHDSDQKKSNFHLFCQYSVQKWLSVARIWNRVVNFGTGCGYPFPATDH